MHDDFDDEPPPWQDSDPVEETLAPLFEQFHERNYANMESALKRNRAMVNEAITNYVDEVTAKVKALLDNQAAEYSRLYTAHDLWANRLQEAVVELAEIVESQQRRIEALERR